MRRKKRKRTPAPPQRRRETNPGTAKMPARNEPKNRRIAVPKRTQEPPFRCPETNPRTAVTLRRKELMEISRIWFASSTDNACGRTKRVEGIAAGTIGSRSKGRDSSSLSSDGETGTYLIIVKRIRTAFPSPLMSTASNFKATHTDTLVIASSYGKYERMPTEFPVSFPMT